RRATALRTGPQRQRGLDGRAIIVTGKTSAGLGYPQPPFRRRCMSRSSKSDPDHVRKRQEQAVEDTFPASDPVPASGNKVDRGPAKSPAHEDHEQAELDEALDESFPASDPPSLSDPDHDDHKH